MNNNLGGEKTPVNNQRKMILHEIKLRNETQESILYVRPFNEVGRDELDNHIYDAIKSQFSKAKKCIHIIYSNVHIEYMERIKAMPSNMCSFKLFVNSTLTARGRIYTFKIPLYYCHPQSLLPYEFEFEINDSNQADLMRKWIESIRFVGTF